METTAIIDGLTYTFTRDGIDDYDYALVRFSREDGVTGSVDTQYRAVMLGGTRLATDDPLVDPIEAAGIAHHDALQPAPAPEPVGPNGERNRLEIRTGVKGGIDITLVTPKGSMGGFELRNGKLGNRLPNTKGINFAPAKLAEVVAAVEAYQPRETVAVVTDPKLLELRAKYGHYEIHNDQFFYVGAAKAWDANDMDAWAYLSQAEAEERAGTEILTTNEGTGTVTVWFGKDDVR